jgi:hypothetical protein
LRLTGGILDDVPIAAGVTRPQGGKIRADGAWALARSKIGELSMKNRQFAVLVAVVLVCLIGWSGYAQTQRSNSARQNWEYKVSTIFAPSAEQTVGQMNQLGADGWELVNVELLNAQLDSGLVRATYTYHFKRPR